MYIDFLNFLNSLCALSASQCLKSVKKCLDPFLKFAITFQLFIVQIELRYCQKGIKKQILNI